jgi:histidine triad (HIT) family protein
MSDCIFCRIARGELPAALIHDDEHAIAFRDIDPRAPTHVLVVPRRHVADLGALDEPGLAGHLLAVCRSVAEHEGVAATGYRVVLNTGSDGGQSVAHLHFHVMGGRTMGWPPG